MIANKIRTEYITMEFHRLSVNRDRSVVSE
jgi:hypothetical protein